MQRRAMRLKKIPVTGAAVELSPGTAVGMPVGRDITQPGPAAIATGGIGTEMLRGGDVTAATSWGSHRGGGGGGGAGAGDGRPPPRQDTARAGGGRAA